MADEYQSIAIEDTFEGYLRTTVFMVKKTATILKLYYTYCRYIPGVYKHNFWFHKDNIMIDHLGTIQSNHFQDGEILDAVLTY